MAIRAKGENHLSAQIFLKISQYSQENIPVGFL